MQRPDPSPVRPVNAQRPPARIAHVVLGLHVGGLERVVVNLVRGLGGSGDQLLVICLEDGGEFLPELQKAGVVVQILRKKRGIDWRVIKTLVQIFCQQQISLVHSHNPGPHFYGVLAAILAGVPVRIHTKHGRNYTHRKKHVFLNRILSWFTDAIVPVSDNARDVLLHLEKVNPNKVHRIWNGVDTELYQPALSQPPAAVSVPVLGTVARLSPEKDQKTMLAAFKLVLDQWAQTAVRSQQSDPSRMPAALRPLSSESIRLQSQVSSLHSQPSALPRLVFVGDGPCMEDLRNEAIRLGIHRQVDWLGARTDVPALLGTFTVFLLSSTTEGISMTILEAMACGLPIVATDVGGNREIVNPPECGCIVPARDPQAMATACLELLRDPPRRAQMGQSARRRVIEHFSLTRMVQEYRRLYAQLLSAKSGVV